MTQSSSSKRPRQETDDSRAECPFSVRLVDPKEKELKVKGKKRRKRGHSTSTAADEDDASKKVLQQCAPFSPKGSFETHSTMDVHYVVEPAKQWAEMTRYNSFVLNGVKYYCEGFIFVANDMTIERQKTAGEKGPRKRSEDDWVARILEIRASDEHHVYARVFWMYWPDELPAGTHYGKKTVQGRQPYHGSAELIASNHMDIINVVSVTSMAVVNHLIEDRDDDVQSALYWRQALDVRTFELSTIEVVCDCNQPANPDKMLVGCGDKACGKWIHEECLKHYALMRVFERLGRDKPHIAEPPVKAETSSIDEVKEPLSPKETGGAVSAQHSIDVKADSVEVVGVDKAEDEDANEDVYRRRREDGSSADGASAGVDGTPGPGPAAASAGTPAGGSLKREVTPATPATATTMVPAAAAAAAAAATATTPNTATTTTTTTTTTATAATTTTPKRMTHRGRKRHMPTLPSFEGKKKPYDKLFEARLLLGTMDSALTMIEVKDLRTNVTGGEKVWQEAAECPMCGSAIR